MIGVFDSGIGGLTVLKSLYAALPQHNFLYLADFGYAPYGNRSESDIVFRSIAIVRWMKQCGVSLVVAACHTSSAVLKTQHASAIETPIITMLQPTLDGILDHPHRRHWTKGIAVLATALSIQKGTLVSALQSCGFDLPIYPVACPPLAQLIEARDDAGTLAYLKSDVFELFKTHPVDMMVYGCTHYPLIEPWLTAHDTPDVIRMDPAEHVTTAVSRALGLPTGLTSPMVLTQDIRRNPNLNSQQRVSFYHTGIPEQGQVRLAKHWPSSDSTHTDLDWPEQHTHRS